MPDLKIGVQQVVLNELAKLEQYLGQIATITSGFRSGDPKEHGQGLAVDVMFPGYPGSLFDLYLAAERFGFKGIGIYPDWKYLGVTKGGLHLDMRIEKPARWTGYRNTLSGNNVYGALNKDELKRLGII